MAVGQRKPATSSKKFPADSFIKCDRPDIADIEIRTNWINPAAISMVTKRQNGNNIHVQILWTCGKTSTLENKAAILFLEKWEGSER